MYQIVFSAFNEPLLKHLVAFSWSHVFRGVLAYGTAQQVEEECKKTLEIMKPTKGYHFAPTHQIQDNTPVENVIAMYNAAHKYGQY